MSHPAKRKLTNEDHQRIISLYKMGVPVGSIARELGIHGQQVAGFVRTMTNFWSGALSRPPLALRPQTTPPLQPFSPSPTPGAFPPAPPMPSQEKELAALAKSVKSSAASVGYFINLAKDRRVYVEAYKEGVVLTIGKHNTALLTKAMAMSLGTKLIEMARYTSHGRPGMESL